MLRTNYRSIQSPNISVDVAKCWENVHKFTQYTHISLLQKNDLSWLNNLFMVRLELIRMSSYVKNKLQMISVAQHQCTRRQIWGIFTQIHPVHSLFVCYKKWLLFTEDSIHGIIIFYSLKCPLILKNKLQMCSVTQHQCRRRLMCGRFS